MTDGHELDKLRKRIDSVDSELLRLLAERARIALAAKRAKGNGTTYRPGREAAILSNVAQNNVSVLPDTSLQAIFAEIIAACRNIEERLRVSYLGPAGSYSHEAAIKLVGSSSDLLPAASIADALRLAESGETNACLLPIENSSEGSVVEAHKLLRTTRLKIMREIRLPIKHNLLSTNTTLSAIKRVYAHPQSLGQCRNWLHGNLPNAELVSQPSNSRAAELAASEPASAAIASRHAATLFGLHVLVRSINDEPGNETRFVLLGNAACEPTGNDKTSIVCVVKNVPGSLHQALGVFADEHINLVRIASQPIGRDEYVFYVDLDGHQQEEPVAKSLKALDTIAKQVTNLGSYPKAGA